jgi:transcriptional regulator with XRE-family HTH domain
MSIKRNIKKSNIFLGKNIEQLRFTENISYTQLGQKINKTKQQIIKYERGEDLVPLPVLEDIATELGQPIAKKIIRRISAVRKLEIENDIEMADELIALYSQILSSDMAS